MGAFLRIAAGCAAGLYLAKAVDFTVGRIVEAITAKTGKKSAGRPKKTK